MENLKLSFDDLPRAVCHLGEEILAIKKMLAERVDSPQLPPQDELLSVKEAADFLRLAVLTVYSKVSRGELPCMKQGNRLYFSKPELIDYLKSGRKKSDAEIQTEADAYLTKSRKGGKL